MARNYYTFSYWSAIYAATIALALCLRAAPSAADYLFVGCTDAKKQMILNAYAPTFARAKAAEDLVGPNAIYETWFGDWSRERQNIVFTQLRDIIAAALIGTPKFTCLKSSHLGCKTGKTQAFIHKNTSYDILLCPIFFEPEDSGGFDRTSVLIHELAHFEIGAGGTTEDHCLLNDATECKKIAHENPDRAVRSADNFRLFIEQAAQLEFGEPLPFSRWPHPTGISE